MPIISAYSIDRGRDSELAKTGTGTATITMIDTNGSLDPAAGATTYNPRTPIAIALGGAPIFVGHVGRWSYEMYPTMTYGVATLECVDGLDILAKTEMVADETKWGDPSANAIYEGNIKFDADDQVKHRIDQALTQADWPLGNREVFTGNVRLQPTTYSPRQPVLNVIDDASDAEFPGIANRWVSKSGVFTFHGRLARFNPTDGQYHITTWNVGDMDNSSGRAVITALDYDVDQDRIINSAFCTPENIADRAVAGQYVQDTASINTHGTLSWSAENLITGNSWLTGKSAVEECKDVFAQYYVTNYKDPQVHVSRISFRWQAPGTDYAAATNALMSGIDISDRVHLKTVNGFDGYHFVEGLHYEARPATSNYLDVTLDVDLSPAAWWDTLPE